MNVKTVKYPSCGRAAPWMPESHYRPSCSERCKRVDLGVQTTEQYIILVVEKDDLPDAPGNDTTGRLNQPSLPRASVRRRTMLPATPDPR